MTLFCSCSCFVLISAALNISKMIGFQDGIFEAILLKTYTREVTGEIRGAFQLAVFLKTLDLKVNKLHDVYAKATILTQQEVTQPDELELTKIEIKRCMVSSASQLVDILSGSIRKITLLV